MQCIYVFVAVASQFLTSANFELWLTKESLLACEYSMSLFARKVFSPAKGPEARVDS